MKENTMAMNLEPHQCVILAQSMQIGTHENKAIHSISTINTYGFLLYTLF